MYFTPLVFRSSNPGCALSRRTPSGLDCSYSETLVQTVFAVLNCAVVELCVLLLGFNVQ